MCGIAGYVVKDKVASPELLDSVEKALFHRGPDDGGVVRIPLLGHHGEAGLANRRLAILDLSASGHQPMSDPATGNWIAYNGEVFNFREIRAELEKLGVSFASKTDTEVVLKAYGYWGESCLEHFRGMFAFAIWDSARQRLFLARDRLGVKPLYYYRRGHDLYFASEVRALLASGVVPRNISRNGLMNFVTFGSVSDPNTLIDGVLSVPPGSFLIWNDGQCEIREYWDLIAAASNGTSTRHISDSELVSQVRSTLHEAFAMRMVSDVPVSVFLSGGIDSGALVAMLADVSPHALQTFSIIFSEHDFNEAYYSRLVADRFQTDHHEILLQPSAFLNTIPEALAAMDQPSLDGLNSYIISREVRAAGFKVALSGLGSDEIFAGYEVFRYVPKLEKMESRLGYLPNMIRRALASMVRIAPGAPMRIEKLASFVEAGQYGMSPYVVTRSLFPLTQQKRIVRNWNPDSYRFAMSAANTSAQAAADLDPTNRVSYLELRNYMLNTLLRDTDAMSMAHSIEVRVPFLDHKLVEFVFSIAGQRKIQEGSPKCLLTSALSELLPEEIVHRPKRGFVLPFDDWLRKDARDQVENVFATWENSAIAEHLDGDAVRSVWHAFLSGKTTWSRVWALYVLRQWVRLHIETMASVPDLVAEGYRA